MAIVLLTIVLSIIGSVISAWIIMLIAGGLHSAVAAEIPAVGFGGALLIVLALSVIGGFFKSASE